jgi:hypothetical protein
MRGWCFARGDDTIGFETVHHRLIEANSVGMDGLSFRTGLKGGWIGKKRRTIERSMKIKS